MKFKDKIIKVIITGDAQKEFEELNRIVGEEIANGIRKSDYQILLRSIKQRIEFLKENPQYGLQIPKNRIPKEYLIKYDANNLWKINLPGAWRIIYTIRGSEVEIISLILDIFNHDDYNKKFRYRKS